MKFIKYAVGLVIALSVIPMVVVAVTKLDEPRLESVEFEVVDVDNGTITFSENTYNNIHSLAILDYMNIFTNLITVKLNNVSLTNFSMYETNGLYYFGEEYSSWDDLGNNDQAITDTYTATIGDKWEMTFEVPRPLPPLVKTLVGFAPLLLIGGILLFMLNKRKLD